MTPSDISAKSTHDLWIDARQFLISISRPTPTSIELVITRPNSLAVVDGAVVLLSDKPISQTNYPQDGQQYASTTPADWLAPADATNIINGAHVVGFYSNILGIPFPTPAQVGTTDQVTGFDTAFQAFTITVNNTNPNVIYYATVHAASNVLQYYPIGVSSYPLAGETGEGVSNSYTGNIPSYPTAPTAPTPGMVYYDQQLNIVQYFDITSQSWIPTRADSIVSGPYNPGILGQVYLYGGSTLRVFDGRKWVDATALNLQLRTGATWTPINSITSQISAPTNPPVGTFYYDYTIERAQYWDGFTWIYPNATNVLFNNGTTLVPAFVQPLTVEPEALNPPFIGQLFYNTATKALNAWNGTSWNKVNNDQAGIASSDKVSIGDDGSYDQRIELIKVLNAQMGWPQQCVELQEEQFNIAIQNALDNYRQYSSGAYKRGFILYKLIPNQQRYYLNSAIDKTDHIVDVHKISRLSPLGIYGGGPSDVWAQAFAQQYYDLAAGGGDLLSTQLLANYGEELTRMFAGDLTYTWDEASHELLITRAIRGYETVVIEAMMERPEQEILQDRWCKQYIQNWALAEVKYMLGMIRSRFASGTPGAAGTINQNGELLVSEARQDMTELQESLLNYEFGGQVGGGNMSFLIG